MYIRVDDKGRIISARKDKADGFIESHDITSDKVFDKRGVPKYSYKDGKVTLRSRKDMLIDETAANQSEETPDLDLPPIIPDKKPIHSSLAERVEALEKTVEMLKRKLLDGNGGK